MSYVLLVLLYLIAAGSLLWALMIGALAKSAVHEILSGVYAVAGIVALIGIGIIHAIHRLHSKQADDQEVLAAYLDRIANAGTGLSPEHLRAIEKLKRASAGPAAPE